MYNVVLTKRAVKNFRKLPEDLQNRCGQIFDELNHSFAPIRLNVKKLKGYENTYRIRVGSWRIIYKVTLPALEVRGITLDRTTFYYSFTLPSPFSQLSGTSLFVNSFSAL